jgi:hypothetical protein
MAAVVLLAASVEVYAKPPAWALLPLAGGRQGALPVLGLAPDLPRAVVLTEMVRVVHATRDSKNRPLAAITEYFGTKPSTTDEDIPVPLDVAIWTSQILGRPLANRDLLPALLADRRASLLAYGLMGLDAQTLDFVSRSPALLRHLYEHDSGVLAAFAGAVRIHDGALVLPGGAGAAGFWQRELDVPLSKPLEAIPELLHKHNGRLAYFADALADLDDRRIGLIFPSPPDESSTVARAMYRAFVDVEPAWNVGEFPFLRIGFDPALLLATVPITAEGRLAGTRAFYAEALEGNDLPLDPADEWPDVGLGDPVTIADLAGRLTSLTLPQRQSWFHSIFTAARLLARMPDDLPRAVYLAHAARRFPALLQTLLRADTGDRETWSALVATAVRIDNGGSGSSGIENALILFQAPIALVERALRAGTIQASTANELMRRVAHIDFMRPEAARVVADWFDSAFLPALGGSDGTDQYAEQLLLGALAGKAAGTSDANVTVEWEGTTYRVDFAAAELARLTDVRAMQAGNVLDTALGLSRSARALASAKDVSAVHAARDSLAAVTAVLTPMDAAERGADRSGQDVSAVTREALTDLSRIQRRGDLRRARRIASSLARAEQVVMSDVLRSLVYALALGEPDGRVFLAGNVAMRHDFGHRLLTATERETTSWVVPYEAAGEAEPWHMRGSLLGLDVGLGRLSLTRTRLEFPDARPSISQADANTLIESMTLTSSGSIDTAQAGRVAEALRNGRARVTGADATALEGASFERLALDHRRAAAIQWTAEADRQDVARLLTLSELVLLGSDGTAVAPEWGSSARALTGCLCLAFPVPPSQQRFIGRPGSGLLASRMSDLKLRVLEGLTKLGLPASLTRGVLAAVLQDYLDDAHLAYSDDWLSMARDAAGIGDDRLIDYISVLTARGPLVPADAERGTDGHQ